MKNYLTILLVPFLFASCNSTKKINNEAKETSANEESIGNKEKMEDDFICQIEVINNVMPSPTPSGYMYAIVSLSAKSGNLINDWKISSFQINGDRYTTYDNSELTGKNQKVYSNTVREIENDIDSPFSATVIFKNDKGDNLSYTFESLEANKVH